MILFKNKAINEFYADNDNSHVKKINGVTLIGVFENNSYIGATAVTNSKEVEDYIVSLKVKRNNKSKKYKVIRL